MSDAVPRIGVRRADAPRPVVADAEARVVRHELELRLGPLTLDLRVDGAASGPWAPVAHAAWPADVDAVVELAELSGPETAPLTALFARTVAPEAAEVRRRMLEHLGLIDARPVDDASLAALDEMVPTPTDVWLLVSSAPSVEVADDSIRGFAGGGAEQVGALDAAFDRVAERLRGSADVAISADREIARLRAELDAARREVDDLTATLARERIETTSVIDDLAGRAAERELTDPPHESPP